MIFLEGSQPIRHKVARDLKHNIGQKFNRLYKDQISLVVEL